jgi:hypothetical protein
MKDGKLVAAKGPIGENVRGKEGNSHVRKR